MSGSEFDVIIAGAGPAGSMTAFHCGDRLGGSSILVLEKAVFPRRKVCAGGLAGRARAHIPFDIGRVVRATVDSFEVNGVLSKEFRLTYGEPVVYVVDRSEFDVLLLQKAKENCRNLVVKQGETVVGLKQELDRVTVQTDTSVYRCKVLVGADGASSRIAKSEGLVQPRDIGLAIEGSLAANGADASQDTIIVDWSTDQQAYAWVFPKGNLLSVGAAGPNARVPSLQARLGEFLRTKGLADDIPADTRSHPLASCNSRSGIVKGRLLLVGDAAGLVEPFTGEGLSGAMQSARLAADSIGAFLSGKQDALARYERLVRSCIIADLEAAQVVKSVFYANPELCCKILCDRPWVWSRCCRVLTGEYTYPKLARLLWMKPLLTQLGSAPGT